MRQKIIACGSIHFQDGDLVYFYFIKTVENTGQFDSDRDQLASFGCLTNLFRAPT